MKRIYSLFILLSFSFSLFAQDLETGYFLGGNPYAFRLNPAFQSERNILSIALGGHQVGVWSNLGVSTLMYPDANGSLNTFLSDRVSASDFMGKIKKESVLGVDARVNLLTIGFWSGEQFYTIDFNVRSLNAASVPRDVFAFLKDDQSQGNYDFSGMGFRAKEMVEAAFGWSRNYDNVFNVGFRVKALVGLAEAEMFADNMKLSMGADQWSVQAKSYLHASSPLLKYSLTDDGYLDLESISLNGGNFKPGGYGAAVDLGASWNVLPCLTLSASILDLGAIRWNREVQGISPETSYVLETSVPEGEDRDWEAELNRAIEELSGVYRFKDASGKGAAFGMLPLQVLLGAEFRMPFYERLSLGALYQGRNGHAFNRHSARLSVNWNPLDFLSLSTGTTLNRLGESIGVALNLHPAGVNLLLGCDYLPFHTIALPSDLVKEWPPFLQRFAYIPRDQMKFNLYVGLNIAFGQSRLDHAKRFRSE